MMKLVCVYCMNAFIPIVCIVSIHMSKYHTAKNVVLICAIIDQSELLKAVSVR